MKKFTPRRQLSELLLLRFFSKVPNRKKTSNLRFNLCEVKIPLDDITKSLIPKSNNKFPCNDSLRAEFYKHFSNELAPVLLDVYNSWVKFGAMGVTSRTGIISFIYRKGDKKDIAN